MTAKMMELAEDAIKNGKHNVLQKLIVEGLDVNEYIYGKHPLSLAIEQFNAAWINYNFRNLRYWQKRMLKHIEILLQSGANPFARAYTRIYRDDAAVIDLNYGIIQDDGSVRALLDFYARKNPEKYLDHWTAGPGGV